MASRFPAIVSSAVLILGLAACGGASAAPAASSAAAAQKPETDKIRLLYPTLSGDQVFPRIAAEKGFFRKYGLDADVQYAQSTTAIASLLSGETQYANSDGVVAIEEGATGSPFKV